MIIFFVLVGTKVELRSFYILNPQNWRILLADLALTLAAFLDKLVSGVVLVGSRVNLWVIGVGMLPRREVGLIFAVAGLATHVINPAEYGALLIMVVLPTVAPPSCSRCYSKPEAFRLNIS